MSRLFAVHALDGADALETRLATYDSHKAYLDTAEDHGVRIVMSGPLMADDHATMIGSLFLIEAETREAVAAFNRNDPFKRAGVWRTVTITGFLRRRG